MADTNDLSPTTAVEAALAPEIDVSAAPSTTGTTTLADDVANAASSLTATSAPGTGTATPNPGTGTVTPFIELNESQRRLSLNVSLADIIAKATAQYSLKNYEDSAELFSQAVEMQTEMNGEMAPENAETLFMYGRSLYQVGLSKSDVLGNKAPAADEAAPKKAKTAKKPAAEAAASTEKTIEEKVAVLAEEAVEEEKAAESGGKKLLFQFTGDENFDESDEEGEDDGAENEGGDDDDDMATAFEILDMARVLYLKKLAALQTKQESEEAKEHEEAEPSAAIRHIKERLGDTHDLLAEISLESDRYTDAIKDSRESLKYKQELYGDEGDKSDILAEAHFKLSLALEFASVTSVKEGNDESEEKPQSIDQGLRDEAIKEMQAAIDCTKAKLQAKQVELATLHSPEDNELSRKQINDVHEMIADMEQRLKELKNPPIDVNAEVRGAAENALGGLFGAGASSSAVEEAKKTATDLTGLVRKKKPAAAEEPTPAAATATETNGHGKRKAEEPADAEAEADSKKAKVEDQVVDLDVEVV